MLRTLIPIITASLGLLSLLTLRSIAAELVLPQVLFLLMAAAVWYGISRVRWERIRQFAPHLYAILIVLLIATLLFGRLAGGATRWISIGGLFNVQISQIAIPAVALFIPWLFNKSSMNTWEGLLSALATVVVPAVLIFVEPDLSTTLILVLSIGIAIFFSEVAWDKIAMLLGSGIILIAMAWLFLLQPYQKTRVLSFIGTEQQPAATYNAIQSQIAVGSGQIWGRGLGQGVQSHLRFLPERQTDFIYASLAEELGFIISVYVIGSYAFLTFASFTIAERATEWPMVFFAYSMSAYLLLQPTINIGMNIGLIPVTGVTLPFLSYGGSSILANALSFGILHRIALEQQHVTLKRIQ